VVAEALKCHLDRELFENLYLCFPFFQKKKKKNETRLDSGMLHSEARNLSLGEIESMRYPRSESDTWLGFAIVM
jgi:hypothetical protein